MKWAYSIKNKFIASIVLLGLCLLVLFSHYLDRIHTKSIMNSIVTLYEDRVIAEAQILRMTTNIYQIREVLNSNSNDVAKTIAINKPIADFNYAYNSYIKTKLTEIENVTALDLIRQFKSLNINTLDTNSNLYARTDKALLSLMKLSTVQLDESRLIMKNTEAEHSHIKASAQFAFAVVILILLVLQALVFSSKVLIPINKPKGPMLN